MFNFIKSLSSNLFGFSTKQKYILFESDDWGAIRMPSVESKINLIKYGFPLHQCPYNSLDSLEGAYDLEALGEVLLKFKDVAGNTPVFTANKIMANPNFEKIEEYNFEKYEYELSTDTYKRFKYTQNSQKIMHQLQNLKLFSPQFHGREHLHVPFWLEDLKKSNSLFRIPFKFGVVGLGLNILPNSEINIQEHLNIRNLNDIEYHKSAINDGLDIFYKQEGFFPSTFIAPNYIWDKEHEKILSDCKVFAIQGMKYQINGNYNGRNKVKHYLGQRNEYNQYYLIRNAHFEPSVFPNIDSVDNCLKQISTAFLLKKPAIISTHRLNYMGHLEPKNSESNLKLLNSLLDKILKKWPDVLFIDTSKLVQIINNS